MVDQRSSVRNPQIAALTSNSNHSEGFSQNSLPSLITYATIAGTRSSTADNISTILIADGKRCSALATHRLNLMALLR
jgi:hypothetical protein